MTVENLEKAKEIEKQISEIKEEMELIPRVVVDWRGYEETGHKCYYIKRLLKVWKNKRAIRAIKGYNREVEIELSEEDLNALIEIRRNKLKELEKQLTEL